MRKLVLTSGPAGGKTTVISAVQDQFSDQVTIVPEVATMLLESGFPVPGRDVDWSEEWQQAFEEAILPTQKAIEAAKTLEAKKKGHKLLVCDRGILDGAAYLPGGLEEFSKTYGVNIAESISRYEAVIHLESLATADPALYGNRFEPLERAVQIEMAIRKVWADHPKRVFIPGQRGVEGKVAQVLGIVRYLLA